MAGDQAALSRVLIGLGLDEEPSELRQAALAALERHGDLEATLERLAPLGSMSCDAVELDRAAPRFDLDLSAAGPRLLEDALDALRPWRKGPFLLARSGEDELLIDAEWRSDLKWERVQALGASFRQKRVLDVGCGNGYFLLRLLGAGAREVIGVEPSLRSILQFLLLRTWLLGAPHSGSICSLVPLRLEQLPPSSEPYDTVLSMGVLYHQRSPLDHLRQLRQRLVPGGELIVETIVVPGPEPLCLGPNERYAGMRNVHQVPSKQALSSWLEQAGFAIDQMGRASLTTSQEQRRTTFSRGPSLEDVLEPAAGDTDDALRKTREGHVRPSRLLVRAHRAEADP